MSNYYHKYLSYKNKYLQLKNIIGGEEITESKSDLPKDEDDIPFYSSDQLEFFLTY